MRTILTSEDVKRIIIGLFEEQDETIIIKEDGESHEANLLDYLNLSLYTWKNRMVSTENPMQPFSPFGEWVVSLNESLDTAIGLIEITDSTVVASQDIDSATIMGKISISIQTDKVKNLEYFLAKVKNAYLGKPQDITNSFGETLKAYINIGSLLYTDAPETMQFGENLGCEVNFSINYLTEALSYEDIPIFLEIDGKEYQLPYIKGTWQNLFSGQVVPTFYKPTQTGTIQTSVASVKTFSFYDFNKPLTNKLNEIFWSSTAFSKKIGNEDIPLRKLSPNINVGVRVQYNGVDYYYKDIIKDMQKDFSNSDFVISSITLTTRAK